LADRDKSKAEASQLGVRQLSNQFSGQLDGRKGAFVRTLQAVSSLQHSCFDRWNTGEETSLHLPRRTALGLFAVFPPAAQTRPWPSRALCYARGSARSLLYQSALSLTFYPLENWCRQTGADFERWVSLKTNWYNSASTRAHRPPGVMER
jgi:hypothetical protein